jgi:2-polyprenyl-6-hydroxyphenyl methylase/3-demethylubiquinone-9 3-methyltransferase
MSIQHTQEIISEKRFQFGKNWQRFLSILNDERIVEAENSIKKMLNLETLEDKTFLDIGSGSGLFSLAAVRLGARQIHSFDYDLQSVACSRDLKRRYFPQKNDWSIEQGDVLDKDYLNSLGQWDIVYSWGVLHHTGNMWQALGNIVQLVKKGGNLFISIYNDQGSKSLFWRWIKRTYSSLLLWRWIILGVFIPYFFTGGLVKDLLRFRNPLSRYTEYKKTRGMSPIYDWLDWLGGYPFEVAKPEEIFDFYKKKSFTLERLNTCGGGLGCNEFVFKSDVPE